MKTIQFIIASILIVGVTTIALIKAYLRRKNQQSKKVEVLTFSNIQLRDQCNGKAPGTEVIRLFYNGKHFTNRALDTQENVYDDAKTVFNGVVDETKITSDTIAASPLFVQASEALDINFQEHDGDWMLGRHVD